MDLSAPAESAVAVVPSDTVNMEKTRGLYVGSDAGNITAIMADGRTVLFSAIPIGTILPIQVTRVNSTATTSTLIIALY